MAFRFGQQKINKEQIIFYLLPTVITINYVIMYFAEMK